jgi:hypothetical protein
MTIEKMIICDGKGCRRVTIYQSQFITGIPRDWETISSSINSHHRHICPRCVIKISDSSDDDA